MRYLSEADVVRNLASSMAVEQLLGRSFEDGIQVIRFVRIDQDRSGSFSVSYFEVSDDGNPDFLDLYEFCAIDPEFPYGSTKSFPSAEKPNA